MPDPLTFAALYQGETSVVPKTAQNHARLWRHDFHTDSRIMALLQNEKIYGTPDPLTWCSVSGHDFSRAESRTKSCGALAPEA